MNFWIGVACANHVAKGVEGGFAQLGHGKHSAVKSLKSGDWITYYSPTTELGGGEKVQSFTAIGQVISEAPYQVNLGDFHPYRVNVDFVEPTNFAPIRPLLEKLELTQGRGSKWGMAVRTSKIKCSQEDFKLIVSAMGIDFETLKVSL